MKNSFLKTGVTQVNNLVDPETDQLIDSVILKHKYLAKNKEEFWLMYSSMILILKQSSDVKMKLFAALLERYAGGQEFGLTKGLKEIIAKETKCSYRSLDNAITYLVKTNTIVKLSKNLYRINPRHVFKGSSDNRNRSLKALLELHCPEC